MTLLQYRSKNIPKI